MTLTEAGGDDLLSWNLGRSRATGLDIAPLTPAERARCGEVMTFASTH